MTRFPLAPMDTLFRVFTYGLFVLPVGLLAMSPLTGPAAPAMWATVALLVAVYAGIWFGWRPSTLEVQGGAIEVHFPLWTRRIPAGAIQSVERYHGGRYGKEQGWGLRVGAGGLWGVFGWLISTNGWVEVYSSRMSDLVLVRFDDRIPLLVSPADLDGFADAVEALRAAGR